MLRRMLLGSLLVVVAVGALSTAQRGRFSILPSAHAQDYVPSRAKKNEANDGERFVKSLKICYVNGVSEITGDFEEEKLCVEGRDEGTYNCVKAPFGVRLKGVEDGALCLTYTQM